MYARERCAGGITSYERNLQGTGEWSLQEVGMQRSERRAHKQERKARKIGKERDRHVHRSR